MTDTATSVEVARLTDQLERSFFGGAWHGPAVLESLEGVEGVGAARRSPGGAHSVWEITGHTGAWMRVAARRIRGEPVASLTDEQNFPTPSDPLDESWSRALGDLRDAYRELQEALGNLTDEDLGNAVSGSDPTIRGLVLGVLQHNAYHAGQIVLLRKTLDGGEPE